MRHHAVKLACAAATLVLLAGCSTIESWNPFASKKTKHSPAELEAITTSLNVRTVWEASVGKAERSVFTPVVLDSSVVVAGSDGTVARLDGTNGRALWKSDAGVRLTAGVGAAEDTIAVVGEKGVIFAYDREGKLRWKAQTTSEVLSAPAVGAGLVIVRSIDNRISAYDAVNGTRKWTLLRTVPPLILRNAPGITIAGNAAFVAVPGGRLLAVALSSGVVLWEGVVTDPKGATELERVADTSGAPVVLGKEVCAVAYQGKVSCFDAVTGQPRWSKEASSDVGVAMDERFVFVADEKGNMTAYARDNGVSVWRNPKLLNRRLSTPFSWGRAVAAGDLEGYIHFYSREDGAFIARLKTDKGAIVAAPVLVGSNLIFQTQNGNVIALATD